MPFRSGGGICCFELGRVDARLVAVIAVNGLLLLIAPRDRLLSVSAALRSAMLAALVRRLSGVGRLPAPAGRFATGSEWLSFVPPAWFVGLEQVLLGTSKLHSSSSSLIGGLVLAITMLLAIGAYTMLYRHFDRVMQRPVAGLERRLSVTPGAFRRLRQRATSPTAVQQFTEITLGRSVLHQGIVVSLSATVWDWSSTRLLMTDL